MRISYLASAALAVSFLPLASPAFAGSAAYSGSDAQSITYGSGTYGSTSHTSHSSGMHSTGSHSSHSTSTRYGSANTAACPSGSNRSSDGYCMTSGSSSTIGISGGSTFASSVYTSPPSMQSVSTEYTSPPSMRHAGGNFSASTSTIVPFRTSVNNISKHRIEGMGSNEFLSETSCPTSVYNPGGAQVLGCYSVVKAAPAPVYRPAPVVVPQIHYQQVRVVRPIIYVRYPVPTPVRVYQQNFSNSYQSYSHQYSSGGCGTAYSRYGNNWPRMGGGCGGW